MGDILFIYIQGVTQIKQEVLESRETIWSISLKYHAHALLSMPVLISERKKIVRISTTRGGNGAAEESIYIFVNTTSSAYITIREAFFHQKSIINVKFRPLLS